MIEVTPVAALLLICSLALLLSIVWMWAWKTAGWSIARDMIDAAITERPVKLGSSRYVPVERTRFDNYLIMESTVDLLEKRLGDQRAELARLQRERRLMDSGFADLAPDSELPPIDSGMVPLPRDLTGRHRDRTVSDRAPLG